MKKKLFCITYAGGTASFFDDLGKALSPEIQVVAEDYPGHGKRWKEPFAKDCASWVEDMAEKINKSTEADDKTALFGYSIGSMIAYELLARDLLKKIPRHVFLASHEAPDLPWRSKTYHGLSDMDFVEALKPKGGFDRIDEKVLSNKSFRRIYFDPVRYDYELIGQYEMSRFQPLSMDTTLFYAPTDTSEEGMRTWERFVPEGSEFIAFEGNHFFLKDHTEEIAAIIKERF